MTAVFLGVLIGLERTQLAGHKGMAHSHLGANPNAVLAEIGPAFMAVFAPDGKIGSGAMAAARG